MKIRRVAGWVAGVVVVAAGALALWYRLSYLPPRLSLADPRALAALQSDARVRVSDEDWIAFWPEGSSPRTGLIFYPGGEVEAEGYAEPLHRVAAAGYPVVIVRMPFYLAVIAPDRADSVLKKYPGIRWVIGGHSLGGAMAARYVSTHPGRVPGLLLWDAYAAPENDLSRETLPVMQLYRTGPDGAVPETYRAAAHLLPPDADRVEVRGGSHLNYGRFIASERMQRESASLGTATLPVDEQHRLAAEATIAFLTEVDRRAMVAEGGR